MSLLHIAGGATEDKLYPEDVFVSYLRTGTGADVTVTTGIDYTKGFMTWTKGRSGATDHAIYDSARGVTKDLVTNSTSAETTQTTGLKAVSTTGHTIGSLAKMNTSGATYVDWVFRKAPKFFDVVTYTGNGIAGRQIPHNLGCKVGMIVVKRTDSISDWYVYNQSLGNNQSLTLNTTNAVATSLAWNNTTPTSTNFTLGSGNINYNGATYVAYLFAHDPSADGIIQCGSYTTDSTPYGAVSLGWEPQYILAKAVSNSSSWFILDEMRGLAAPTNTPAWLGANLSNAEASTLTFNVNSTEFTTTYGTSTTFIYIAIRRPMKVPTSGTQVYNAVARTGTGVATTVSGVGFAPDLLFSTERAKTIGTYHSVFDRLRGATKWLRTSGAQSEAVDDTSVVGFDVMDGVRVLGDTNQATINYSSKSFITHFFKRAKGFFDVVCYTGDGTNNRNIAHSLGVPPELIINKCRISTVSWAVYHAGVSTNNSALSLNQTGANPVFTGASNLWGTGHTNITFGVGNGASTTFPNFNEYNYVAYLFASCPGVSKVGSYTGNGSSQTINCGFSAGARFVLIKRTDSAGDWYIWDTARGIVAANDPHLSLNTTAAEVTTDDSVDPEASGFIVNQNTATNINVNGASYIFLAIS